MMPPSGHPRIEGIQLLHRDPLHRLPRCWYIRTSRMLQHLDDRTVQAVARDSAMAAFKVGELLHQAGAPMESITFISQGRVKVYRLSRDGKQQTITLLGAGDAFGEISLVDRRAQDCSSKPSTTWSSAGPAATRSCGCAAAIRPWRSDSPRRWARSSRRPASASRIPRSETSADVSPILVLTLLERERRLAGSDDLDRVVPGPRIASWPT